MLNVPAKQPIPHQENLTLGTQCTSQMDRVVPENVELSAKPIRLFADLAIDWQHFDEVVLEEAQDEVILRTVSEGLVPRGSL